MPSQGCSFFVARPFFAAEPLAERTRTSSALSQLFLVLAHVPNPLVAMTNQGGMVFLPYLKQ